MILCSRGMDTIAVACVYLQTFIANKIPEPDKRVGKNNLFIIFGIFIILSDNKCMLRDARPQDVEVLLSVMEGCRGISMSMNSLLLFLSLGE